MCWGSPKVGEVRKVGKFLTLSFYGLLNSYFRLSVLSDFPDFRTSPPPFKLQNKKPIFAHDKIHDRVWNCQF